MAAARITREENESLGQVDRGTPMGEFLRRYWWPVGFTEHLKDKPTLIRLLGEDLVLFRDGAGRLGVLGAQCAHRRANLCLGSVSRSGLRCRYHGWLYDPEGHVLETPGEPPESTLKDRVQQLAYPAQELGGLIFTYLGPAPAPLLPRFHFLAAEGERVVRIQAFNNCNWLQCVENGIDPLHISFLHSDVWTEVGPVPVMRFEENEWGVVYKAYRPGTDPSTHNYREQWLMMPGITVAGDVNRYAGGATGELPVCGARWSVPIDATHTMHIRAHYLPVRRSRTYDIATRFPVPIAPYKEYLGWSGEGVPELGYTFDGDIAREDATILESMGPLVDRENETLTTAADDGVRALRQMYRREIAAVQAGRDPLGTVRDEEANRLIVLNPEYSPDKPTEPEQAGAR
jgi:5,5'-dehydrodivanillate O-demethylase oxygenase subunit